MNRIPSEQSRVMQICWVVDDIDAAMASWTKVMGIGPFYIFRDLQIDTVRYRGMPTSTHFSIAMAQAGGVQIELAQQHCNNPSAYRDLVESGENGLHHIAIYVADYDAALAHFTDQGLVAAIEGTFGEMRFAYVDTSEPLGCMVEIIEHDPLEDRIFARVAEGAENWDGVTEPVRPGFPKE
ncbi:MAG: VOC family protein [Sphingobium sp.]